MSETFVPLVPAKSVPSATGFTALPGNGQGPKTGAPAPAAPATTASVPAPGCAKPTITLQRDGETVSSIRVECGCGQVIDITCAY